MNSHQNNELVFGYTEKEYRLFSRYAWRFLLLFSFLYLTLYCTRLNLSAAAPVMMSELGFTKSQFGILTSVLFWTYGIGQLVNGRLSDSFGPEMFIILSVLLSISANIIIAFHESFPSMVLIWAINGFAQSMAWASGIAIITRWWPGEKRGFATGFALAFSGFGQVAATLSVTFALTAFPKLGWKAAFIIPSFFPLLMLALYVIFARTKPESIGLKEYTESNGEERSLEAEMKTMVKSSGMLYPYKYVLSNRGYRAWVAIAFLGGLARYGLSTWVPIYFIENYGIKVTSGLIQSLALPVGMGVGTLVVAALTDKYCPNNRIVAAVFAAASAAVTVFSLVFLDPRVLWQLIIIELLLFISGFSIFAISGASGAYAADVGGRVFSGTATGMLSFTAYMGAALQSFVYGFSLETLGWRFVFFSIATFCIVIVVISTSDALKTKKELDTQENKSF